MMVQFQVKGIGNVDEYKNSLIENVILVDSLKHDLVSISLLRDRCYKVLFVREECHLYDLTMKNIFAKGFKRNNIYMINIRLQCMCVNIFAKAYRRNNIYRIRSRLQ